MDWQCCIRAECCLDSRELTLDTASLNDQEILCDDSPQDGNTLYASKLAVFCQVQRLLTSRSRRPKMMRRWTTFIIRQMVVCCHAKECVLHYVCNDQPLVLPHASATNLMESVRKHSDHHRWRTPGRDLEWLIWRTGTPGHQKPYHEREMPNSPNSRCCTDRSSASGRRCFGGFRLGRGSHYLSVSSFVERSGCLRSDFVDDRCGGM
jgi:hypothetical protein